MKNTYNCVIVDDEPKAIGLLKECLATLYDSIEVTDSFTSWNTALVALREKEYDIVFMDVSMPGKSGMDLLTLLPGLDAEIIFITAHSEFAISAFKFAASGYVLKPINDKELTTAVDKAIERIQFKRMAKHNTTSAVGTKIGIPDNKGINYVSIDEIIYLEAKNSCTAVVTLHSEIISSYNLSRFRIIVEKHAFYQVHRSYLINLNFIKRYTANGTVMMTNGIEIPVSKNVREDFLLQFHRVSKND